MSSKDRLDKLLFEKGLVRSREKARAFILEGKVFVNGRRIDKCGTKVDLTSEIRLEDEGSSYVSRGGEKLKAAIDAFGIVPKDWVVMDVGASTGGFTDCILQEGARKVYAVDVGYGQLAWKLQQDSRVVNLERRNIRYLRQEEVGEKLDLILIDTSFISIKKFLPHLLGFLKEGGMILGLIKPQFEVERGKVGKGGVVRDTHLHQIVIDSISAFASDLGLKVLGVVPSPLLGPKGNKEFFIWLKKEDSLSTPGGID